MFVCTLQASSVDESAQGPASASSDQGADDRRKALFGDSSMSALEKYESLTSGGLQTPKQESSGGFLSLFGSRDKSVDSETEEKESTPEKADSGSKFSFGRKAAEKSPPQQDADVTPPTTSKFSMPKAPKVDIPELPKLETPKINIPQMPKFQSPAPPKEDSTDVPATKSTPQIALPKFEAPKFGLPQKPSVDDKKSGESSGGSVSKEASEAKGFKLPSFEAPKIDMPSIPSFSIPKRDTDEQQVVQNILSKLHINL